MKNGNEKIETILTLAKEVNTIEAVLAAKRAQLAETINSAAVHTAEGKAAPTDHGLPVSARLRDLMESAPGKRFGLKEIRSSLPDASALALRKALYRLTHEVKGFARDKRTRGVYYYKGEGA